MGQIKILPDTLISQIAAGEVVERPASAVKELLENSLDAGANFCGIEIEQGGMKLISVRDDGCGMEPEDAALAFARHATSKISQLEDLTNIRSFGFRGEALAAIASVSFVMMKTRQKNSESGCEIIYKGGKLESAGATGCPPGTEVIVRNLFFNTPARKKFLKSENTELSHIVAVVSHLAIANPNIGFELKHNGKTFLHVAPNSKEEMRMTEILGKNFLEDARSVSFKTETIHIHGFIGRPGMSLSSKRHQYLFVNNRDVSEPLVSRAVLDAYGNRLPARSFPMYVLHIDIDPGEVDVNVHPRKLSVKFLDTRRVYRDVVQAVSQALQETGHRQQKTDSHDLPTPQAALEFTKEFIGQEKRAEGLVIASESACLPAGRKQSSIISQIANSYILTLDEEGLSIIDQHAAHERILYEKFKAQMESKMPSIQPLLLPITLECSREESIFLKDALQNLTALGFEFDEWSGNTFVIRAVPAPLKTDNLEKVFREFLEEVMMEKSTPKLLSERILKSLACKAAIKFGMPLSRVEQEELLLLLEKTPNNSTCPHGRPTQVRLTFAELEKRFYRK